LKFKRAICRTTEKTANFYRIIETFIHTLFRRAEADRAKRDRIGRLDHAPTKWEQAGFCPPGQAKKFNVARPAWHDSGMEC
jgi:hypothetical protein